MHLNSILEICIFTIAISASVLAKDDHKANQPFKINKLNLIWGKAERSLGSSKLKDLKSDLTKHEVDELSLKKLKAHNQDRDGLIESAVRKKLRTILAKYALEQYYDDVHPPVDGKNQRLPEGHTPEDMSNLPMFRDSKLDKLWKKAEKSGFSQDQLMILHEEFQHQQDKLNDHYDKMSAIDEEITRQKGSAHENSLYSDIEDSSKKKIKSKPLETASEKKARLESNLHQSLKDKYSDTKRVYESLQKRISSGIIDDDKPFEEDVVNNLWARAEESNFSPTELESLKEELEHYEIRVKKLKHFKNELEQHLIGSKDYRSYGEYDDEIKHINKKVQDLNMKVDKTHKSIERMIKNKRDEL